MADSEEVADASQEFNEYLRMVSFILHDPTYLIIY